MYTNTYTEIEKSKIHNKKKKNLKYHTIPQKLQVPAAFRELHFFLAKIRQFKQ